MHNEDVVRGLKKAGLKKINRLTHGKDKFLLISAHGVPKKTIEKAKKLCFKIIDATCPMVKGIHDIVRKCDARGFHCVVIGDKKHTEVRGIIGQTNKKSFVIDDIKNIPIEKFKRIKQACIVVQSTQNPKEAVRIAMEIMRFIPKVLFLNTVCRATIIRQQEIRLMPLENQVMIIIGSKMSANTRRLYEISKSLNQRSFWVSNSKEIKRQWFRGIERVGVTAGASTPGRIIQEAICFIKK